MNTKSLRIEYEETVVPPGQALEVEALDFDHVRVLEVAQIGPDLRYRYLVAWENGDV